MKLLSSQTSLIIVSRSFIATTRHAVASAGSTVIETRSGADWTYKRCGRGGILEAQPAARTNTNTFHCMDRTLTHARHAGGYRSDVAAVAGRGDVMPAGDTRSWAAPVVAIGSVPRVATVFLRSFV